MHQGFVGRTVLATLLLVGPLAAEAQARGVGAEPNAYFGVGLGRSSANLSEATDFAVTELRNAGFTGISENREESDTAVKVYGGYRFHQNFALEAGYINFGDFKATVSATSPVPGTITANWKPAGFYVDAVGIIPLNDQAFLFGKAGAMFARLDAHASATVAGIVLRASGDDNDTNLKLGAGIQWDFARSVGMRVEYERVNNLGDKNTTGEGDISLWSLGLHLRF
jgi:OmpA-OmpF porin, OOP family